MRGPRGVALVALLLLTGCGGRATVPVVSSPAERINPAHPAGAADSAGRNAAGDGTRFDETGVAEADLADSPNAPRPSGGAADAGAPDEDAGEMDRDDGEPDTPLPGDPGEAVYHILARGQTLYSVAREYHVNLATLMEANGITDPTRVRADTPILIPGLHRSHSAGGPASMTALPLEWPLRGTITGPFGPRGRHHHHAGLDIDGEKGDPILAAAPGTVLDAGVDGRYGRRVVIDHGDGVVTLYAHASKLLVHPGEQVRAGEPVAEVGRSGNARGTHLHFEVRRDGRAVNPLPYLQAGEVMVANAAAGLALQVTTHKTPAKPAARAKRHATEAR
jgi:LysM repeat protein